MTKYTNEKKEHALGQMSAPHNKPGAEEQRYSGVADAVLKQRREVYAQAREWHPLRWKRSPRAWQLADEVWLNPPSKLDQRHAA